MQEERGRADVLRRLHEREQGRGEDRALHAGLPEDPVRERGEGDEDHRRESAAGELQNEHLPEQPSQTAPIVGRDVAEPVLRERLLDGQVEQHLEEADRRHRGGEDAELGKAEDPGGDDRPEDAAGDGGVDPDGRERPSPERPGGHGGSV